MHWSQGSACPGAGAKPCAFVILCLFPIQMGFILHTPLFSLEKEQELGNLPRGENVLLPRSRLEYMGSEPDPRFQS